MTKLLPIQATLKSRIVLVAFLVVLGLAGCRPAPTTPPNVVAHEATLAPTATATPSPTATPTPLPTSTSTATPIPTDTPTPSPTPTPLHPMSIAYMRQQSYPGSDFVIEETLNPGTNYDRYVASHLSEGLRIYGLLTVPRGEKPASGWPIIVFNHGHITPELYRTTERYVAYQDTFARSGYITFKSDYRGHGSSEGNASGGSRWSDYTIDVLHALSSLQRLPEADAERVGMWGHSMGGGITLRAMVVTNDIDAGVIWAGTVATFEEIYTDRPRWVGAPPTLTPGPEGTPPARLPRVGLFSYGMFDENPDFWAAIDPVSYLSDLSGPVQLHHATGDQSVPVSWSESLYTRLQDAGQTAELFVYQGDDHNISANFGAAAQRSVEFFDRYVKGAGAE